MGRIVEVLMGLNALGGIAAFFGFRYAGRRVRDRILGNKELPPEAPASGIAKGEK